MSKTKKMFLNGAFSIVNMVLTSLLAVFIRKLFVIYFPIEYLGINGLYSNLLGILSLAELGIASVINYNLYKELAVKNFDKINIIMSLYGKLYSVIGTFVFSVGSIFYFLLPFIVKETNNIPWNYIKLVFVIQLFSSVSSYFLAYKRTMFIADQCEYICLRVDLIFRLFDNGFKIIAIIVFKNFIIYSLTSLFTNIAANIVINFLCNKKYTYIKHCKTTKIQFQELNIFKDIKYLLLGKITSIIYFNTDNVIISYFLGLKYTGIMSNYVVLNSILSNLVPAATKGIAPMVSTIIYSDNKDSVKTTFYQLDLFYFFVSIIFATGYIISFQPFIELFFGLELLLPYSYVICLTIIVFMQIQFQGAYDYRSTFGQFEQDLKYNVLSAIMNLIISILFVRVLGIVGVLIGTIIGLLFILYGRIQFVFRIILKEKMNRYFFRHLFLSVIGILEIFFVWFITKDFIIKTWGTFVLKTILCVVLIIVIQFITLLPMRDFRFLFFNVLIPRLLRRTNDEKNSTME